MTREFQVLYQHTDNTGTAAQVPKGEVLTCLAMAEAEDQLEAQFAAGGFHVVGVNLVRPVVDWSKPNFDRDEAAAFMGIAAGTFSANKGAGNIPWCDLGRGLCPRKLLEQMIIKGLNAAGKALAEELKAA